jgi:hypothetical protein
MVESWQNEIEASGFVPEASTYFMASDPEEKAVLSLLG